MSNSILKLGHTFQICANQVGKVTELFANGFLYHTLDLEGNCLIGQQYLTRSDYHQKFEEAL
jgi:hypothetical protein